MAAQRLAARIGARPSAPSGAVGRGGGGGGGGAAARRPRRAAPLATAAVSAPAAAAPPPRDAQDEVVYPTKRELRDSVPAECFKPNVWASLGYAAVDLGLLGLCFGVFAPAALAQPLLLPAYWGVTGLVMWMNFVIGHDCGHGSFSRSQLLNGVVGHLTHAPLMVPFYPWAYSHKQHHRFHQHRTKDMSHPWWSAEEYKAVHPIVRVLALDYWVGTFLAFPGYLLLESKRFGTDGSHFWPGSRLFDNAPKAERRKCAISSAVCVGFLAATLLASGGSLYAWVAGYAAPYLVFSWWLFTVTYMQHHSDETEVYEEGEWNYVKGACQTIDREFGGFVDAVTHRITSDHVAHHLFSDMPHYKLQEATAGVRSVLEPRGLYQRRDTRNFVSEVFRLYREKGHCLESSRPRAFREGA